MTYPRTSPLRWVFALAAAITVVGLPVSAQAQTATGAQTTGSQTTGSQTTGTQIPAGAQPTTGGQPTSASQIPAGAQPVMGAGTGAGTIRITIDTPAAGATVINGGQTNIGGWAADTAAGSAGIDAVHIYLDGPMDGGGTLIGTADYGGARPDVAAALGNSAFTNTGFDFVWSPATLTGGQHTLYIYAHSVANGWASTTVNVTGPGPAPSASTQPAAGSSGQMGAGPVPSGPTTPYGGTYLPGSGSYGSGYAPGGYPGGCAVDYIDFRTPMCPGSIGYGSPPGVQNPYPPYPGQACIMIYPPDPSCAGLSGYPPIYPPTVYPPYRYPPPTSNGIGPGVP